MCIWAILPVQTSRLYGTGPADAPRLSRNGIGLFQGFGLGGFAENALIHENQLAPRTQRSFRSPRLRSWAAARSNRLPALS